MASPEGIRPNEVPGVVRIRITQIPDGPAPEEIRSSWVGAELNALRLPPGIPEIDFTSGRTVPGRGGYIVDATNALLALEKNSDVAAAWFRLNLPPDMPSLTFGLGEAEIIPQEKT